MQIWDLLSFVFLISAEEERTDGTRNQRKEPEGPGIVGREEVPKETQLLEAGQTAPPSTGTYTRSLDTGFSKGWIAQL